MKILRGTDFFSSGLLFFFFSKGWSRHGMGTGSSWDGTAWIGVFRFVFFFTVFIAAFLPGRQKASAGCICIVQLSRNPSSPFCASQLNFRDYETKIYIFYTAQFFLLHVVLCWCVSIPRFANLIAVSGEVLIGPERHLLAEWGSAPMRIGIGKDLDLIRSYQIL